MTGIEKMKAAGWQFLAFGGRGPDAEFIRQQVIEKNFAGHPAVLVPDRGGFWLAIPQLGEKS